MELNVVIGQQHLEFILQFKKQADPLLICILQGSRLSWLEQLLQPWGRDPSGAEGLRCGAVAFYENEKG